MDKDNMEKPPKNTNQAIRFSGGVSKILRNMEKEIATISQNLARASDLISFYERELKEIATAKSDETWAQKIAKQTLKTGAKM
jgi:hypothetical protein